MLFAGYKYNPDEVVIASDVSYEFGAERPANPMKGRYLVLGETPGHEGIDDWKAR